MKKKEKLLEKTRKLSAQEGAVSSVMFGGAESHIIPYAIELGANNLQTGLLASLANLFAPMAQIFGSRMMEKFHRKKIIFWSVFFQAAVCLFLSFLGIFFLLTEKALFLVPIFIISYVIYHISGSIAGPAWFSMMGDVVPEEIRGKYFSFRNKISGIAAVTATLIAAAVLYYFQQYEIIVGFIIIFSAGGMARLISGLMLRKHYIEELKLEKDYYFPFWKFIKDIPKYNFNKFTVHIGLVKFAANIAGPFFAVYTWSHLRLNPIWFTAIIISAGVFNFLFFPLWGKFADKYGNRELLRISNLILIFPPLFWMLSDNPIYLLLVPQFFAGAGWSAFNLSSSNFIYDSVGPKRRGMLVAYSNLIGGFGIFLGATLGGFITQYVTLSFINIFFFVFLLSSLLRFVVFLFVLPMIKEVRKEYHPGMRNPLNYLRDIEPIYGTFHLTAYPFKRFINFTHKIKINRKSRITYY